MYLNGCQRLRMKESLILCFKILCLSSSNACQNAVLIHVRISWLLSHMWVYSPYIMWIEKVWAALGVCATLPENTWKRRKRSVQTQSSSFPIHLMVKQITTDNTWDFWNGRFQLHTTVSTNLHFMSHNELYMISSVWLMG